MQTIKTKRKWLSWLRLLCWILVIQFVLLKFSTFLHAGKLTKFYPIIFIKSEILGVIFNDNLNGLNNKLEKNGYVNFNETLPHELIKKIHDFALKTKTRMAPKYDEKILFDKNNVESEIYRFDANDIANSTEIQELIMDPFLIDVARNYLKSEPIFDFPAMWWSTAFLKEASGEAAQLYHFDLDRIKWLKIFFYITDVNENTGPHCYIEGSHLANTKPKEILKRGYARIPDEDLEKYYSKEKFKTICAPAGAIFAGYTKCLQKGTPLKENFRLVLKIEINVRVTDVTFANELHLQIFIPANLHIKLSPGYPTLS